MSGACEHAPPRVRRAQQPTWLSTMSRSMGVTEPMGVTAKASFPPISVTLGSSSCTSARISAAGTPRPVPRLPRPVNDSRLRGKGTHQIQTHHRRTPAHADMDTSNQPNDVPVGDLPLEVREHLVAEEGKVDARGALPDGAQQHGAVPRQLQHLVCERRELDEVEGVGCGCRWKQSTNAHEHEHTNNVGQGDENTGYTAQQRAIPVPTVMSVLVKSASTFASNTVVVMTLEPMKAPPEWIAKPPPMIVAPPASTTSPPAFTVTPESIRKPPVPTCAPPTRATRGREGGREGCSEHRAQHQRTGHIQPAAFDDEAPIAGPVPQGTARIPRAPNVVRRGRRRLDCEVDHVTNVAGRNGDVDGECGAGEDGGGSHEAAGQDGFACAGCAAQGLTHGTAHGHRQDSPPPVTNTPPVTTSSCPLCQCVVPSPYMSTSGCTLLEMCISLNAVDGDCVPLMRRAELRKLPVELRNSVRMFALEAWRNTRSYAVRPPPLIVRPPESIYKDTQRVQARLPTRRQAHAVHTTTNTNTLPGRVPPSPRFRW